MIRLVAVDADYRNVLLLALANVLATSALPMMMLAGGLLGMELAPSEELATLPIALLVIGTALGILPATRCMARLGRKTTFMLYCLFGSGCCLLAAASLPRQSFLLFCVAATGLGAVTAALQQVRFAAMEVVAPERGPTAASIIMCGGIVSALVGPELALRGRELTAFHYQGSFYFIAALFLLAAGLFALYRPAAIVVDGDLPPPRPLSQMLAEPNMQLAIFSAAVAFAVMTLVMTGTPLSMHHHHGHSLADTKWVLQSHMVAMFAPSLIAPWLFARIGIKPLMAIGLVCYGVTVIVGLIDTSVMGFWSQLVMLGLGWNFLFLGGTTLLPTSYRPGEQYRAQAFNDTAVFSCQSVAALSAGWVISVSGWSVIMLLCLLPMSLMAGGMILFSRRK